MSCLFEKMNLNLKKKHIDSLQTDDIKQEYKILNINNVHLFNYYIVVIVPEYGQCIYEDIQFDMHDVTHRTLVWMSTIPCP